MLKKRVFASVFALTALFLAGCVNTSANPASSDGNGSSQQANALSIVINGPTSVEVKSKIRLNVTLTNDSERLGFTISSSDTAVATVDADGYVTGVKVGQATITAAAAKDATVKVDYVIDVVESSLPSMNITADSNKTILGGDKVAFKSNLINNTSYTPTYTWTSKNGKGALQGAHKAEAVYQSIASGSDVIELEVNVGPYLLRDTFNFFVSENFTDGTWTEISTVEAFKSNILTGGTVSKNFYLSADIDLAGAVIAVNSTAIAGKLDGKGHTVKNYVVAGDSTGANGGLFSSVSGTIENIGFVAEIAEAGSGWGTGAIANGCTGTMQNIYLDVNHSYDTGKKAVNGYVPFCAGIVGIAKEKSKYIDIVVNVQDTEGKATVYADTAYPVGGGGLNAGAASDQSFKFQNIYTNTTVVGGQMWDWGNAVIDTSDYTSGMSWADSKADDYYTLSPLVWNLADGQVPTLINL